MHCSFSAVLNRNVSYLLNKQDTIGEEWAAKLLATVFASNPSSNSSILSLIIRSSAYILHSFTKELSRIACKVPSLAPPMTTLVFLLSTEELTWNI